MTTENCEDDELPPPPDYPALFRQYVVRSITATHATVAAQPLALADEPREQALHVLSFALELAEAWPATRDLLLLLAPKMEQAGYRDDWVTYLQRGLVCSQQHNDRLAGAELQLQIGHLYRLQSHFEQAQQALAASAAEFAALGNTNGQARALNRLAHMKWHQREFTLAQQLATTALALLPPTDPERAASFLMLGLAAVSWQDLQEAKHYFEQALQIYIEQGDQQRAAWSMQHLGQVLRSLGKLSQATQYYEKAIYVLTEIQDLRNCAIGQMELGIVYWLTEQSSKALELYDLAEPYFRKAQDYLYLAKILTNRGLGYLTLREWQPAIESFTASAALYEKLDDRYGQLNALDGLGLTYTGMGAYGKAITVFERAFGQLSGVQDDPSTELLRTELTVHLQQAKEKKARPGDAP